jgi:hypothetical protein
MRVHDRIVTLRPYRIKNITQNYFDRILDIEPTDFSFVEHVYGKL